MRGPVLVIDDDRKLRGLLTEYLARGGFQVIAAGRADDGLRLLRTEHPTIVILDVMLPGMDGFEACRAIRRESAVPIIMLTARGDVTDRVVGLELGADDYLAKPFEPRELIARIDAILRRGRAASDTWSFGDLRVDPARRAASMDGEPISLTTAEFDLLELLIRGRGRVLSRGHILDGVRGEAWDNLDRSIDVLVSRLRNKLGDDPRQPRYVRTVRGAGYAFVGAPNDDT
ncbi:MAG: response regulator transcription factor [Gemmatimonadota bacterium]|nr:response regulator transcription factor [Gemmatimonadota bacterium]MDH3422686.1 response regulator transcription factor [Gemmatimonadota bacterium]